MVIIFAGIVLIAVILVIQSLYASFMSEAASRKGYGDDAHAWAMCFWLGIIGGLYVIALPDLILQEQNQRIIELLKGEESDD